MSMFCALGFRVMRKSLLILIATLSLLFNSAASSNAATQLVDISDLAGFQQNGVGGTAGNGIVFLSPKYTFGFGDTLDFGTALVSPDPPDDRGGGCGVIFPACFGNAGFSFFYLTNGSGGLDDAPFDIGGSDFVDCTGGCGFAQYRLLFNLPTTSNGIQFVFQGSEVSIVPPTIAAVPEPSTWAMLLIGFAGLAFAGSRRSVHIRT
jgi:hypothetical protein